MTKRRVILYPYSIANEVDDVARKHGWKLAQVIEPKDDQFYEEIWEVDGGRAVVRFIDDHFVGVGYVSISGSGAEEAERKLRSSMRTLADADVMRTAESGKPKDRALAIRSLAATTLEPESDRLLALIDAAADDEDMGVRLAAIKAMARLGSRKHWPIVERRSKAETNEKLRPEIDALVDAYRHYGKTSESRLDIVSRRRGTMKYAMDMALPEQFPLDKLKQVLEGLGYRWVQHIPEGEVQIREEIWELPDRRGIVRYIFDQHVNVPSIRAESDIWGEPGKILLEIYPHLPLLDTGDLVRLAQSTQSAERRYGLRALASVTTDFEWRVVEEFSKVLKDPDPKMRMLAMVCIARYPYKLFAKELEEHAKTEPDERNKAEALALAKDLRERGKESQF